MSTTDSISAFNSINLKETQKPMTFLPEKKACPQTSNTKENIQESNFTRHLKHKS